MASSSQDDRIARKLLNEVCANRGSCVFNDDSWAAMYRKLSRYGCNEDTEEHEQAEEDQLDIEEVGLIPTVDQFVASFPNIFQCIKKANGRQTVVKAAVRLRICKQHCTKNGSCPNPDSCPDLHCCRFLLLSHCQYGKHCRYGHDVKKSTHNRRLLRRYYADRVAVRHLGILLRGATEAPPICKFYNVQTGCRLKEPTTVTTPARATVAATENRAGRSKEGCFALHICSYFVRGACKYGARCSRSHMLATSRNKMVLSKYGVNTGGTEEQLLTRLRASLGITVDQKKNTVSSSNRRSAARKKTVTVDHQKQVQTPAVVLQTYNDDDIDSDQEFGDVDGGELFDLNDDIDYDNVLYDIDYDDVGNDFDDFNDYDDDYY